ncbi:hypothetical protein J3454_01280 [Erythrobacter sp. NFXS35]|uniref:hypothetical protein n=1 Tax=Erythrobacter sp. NFXS35 TaxID=2818436 RepID=UPI0032DF4874
MTRPDLTLAREFEAAFAWWQAAGVDCDFADDATAWLAAAAPALAAIPDKSRAGARRQPSKAPGIAGNEAAVPARTAPQPAAPGPLRRDLLGESAPADCAAFRDWWLNAPGLDTAQGYPRIAPRGEKGAALMVLVPQPEQGDRERLLEGPQGRLLANIIAAMGLDEGAVYVASALACHTPMADLAACAAGGMDAVTAHHIALAAPQRLLVLGTALGPMLSDDAANGLREINHTAGKVPTLMSETLEAMMDVPRLKARFWRRWMEWSATQ